MEVRQAAVVGHFRFGKVLAAPIRALVQGAVAGHGVEELIVNGGQQDVAGKLSLQQPHFVRYALPSRRQFEALRHGRLNGVDVVRQLLATFANDVVAGIFAVQLVQFLFEHAAALVDVGFDFGQRLGGIGGHETRRRVDQIAGALGDAERRRHLRHAALVDAALRLVHAVEREPRHQARHQRERHRRAEAGVQLRRDAEAAVRDCAQAFPQCHGTASRKVAMGRYLPCWSITVKNT